MPAPSSVPLLQRLRGAASPRWLWALLLALCLAPALGQMHEVLHGPHAHGAHAGEAHDDAHGWAALFAGHGTAADCHLFDQLSHGGGAAPVLAQALPLLPAVQAFAAPATGRLAVALAAAFQARAPPVFR
ncbi:hypothetical protein PY257_11080 [Ramlibacter sp. H39-3-26]|uniref:hypothetical protein n=1 Tax=Curvibacter soli TaxID=3031331 RepID=UPI0023DB61C0|nr:hypothetical protein [Ramlibacter sp. H39-3-26]MDF1485714.1 hypothetical protein [Ramlibacter sp. H39-3-26]